MHTRTTYTAALLDKVEDLAPFSDTVGVHPGDLAVKMLPGDGCLVFFAERVPPRMIQWKGFYVSNRNTWRLLVGANEIALVGLSARVAGFLTGIAPDALTHYCKVGRELASVILNWGIENYQIDKATIDAALRDQALGIDVVQEILDERKVAKPSPVVEELISRWNDPGVQREMLSSGLVVACGTYDAAEPRESFEPVAIGDDVCGGNDSVDLSSTIPAQHQQTVTSIGTRQEFHRELLSAKRELKDAERDAERAMMMVRDAQQLGGLAAARLGVKAEDATQQAQQALEHAKGRIRRALDRLAALGEQPSDPGPVLFAEVKPKWVH